MQSRRAHIDALKILASQSIVLHHFAAYGPIGDAISMAAPDLMEWLYDYARMMVQAFLVLGGYLATQSLEPSGGAHPAPLWRTLLRRYQRLILPFLVALALSALCAAAVRQWMPDEYIPAAPTWMQVLAHALLLHGVLGYEALSAGAWYVAIDFQLFALMASCLWVAHQVGRGHAFARKLARALVVGLLLLSLFHFNRDPDWDDWALYFFAAYGMGAVAAWAGKSRRPGLILALLALIGVSALALDFRGRIALALVVALWLGTKLWPRAVKWRHKRVPALPTVLVRPVSVLGQASYALFLVHFPVLMLGNALFVYWGLTTPLAGVAMLLLSWGGCTAVALWFAYYVEIPLSRWSAQHGLRRL